MILKHILQEDLDVVAMQETIKLDFLDKELKEMSGTSIFNWFWIPAKGHSGGLLLGVKDDSYEVEDVNKAEFFLGVLVRHRQSNFRFWILNIYGLAQHEKSESFIQEVSAFCENEVLPILLGGTST